VSRHPSRVLLEFVSELLATEQQKMVDAESALLTFKQAHSLDSIKQETQALQDLVRKLEMDHDEAMIEQDRAAIVAKIHRDEKPRRWESKEIEDQVEAEGGAAPNTKQFYHDLAMQHQATASNYEAQRDGYTRSLQIYDEMIKQRTEELNNLLSSIARTTPWNASTPGPRTTMAFCATSKTRLALSSCRPSAWAISRSVSPPARPTPPLLPRPCNSLPWVAPSASWQACCWLSFSSSSVRCARLRESINSVRLRTMGPG